MDQNDIDNILRFGYFEDEEELRFKAEKYL